jgi:hypothetical protein
MYQPANTTTHEIEKSISRLRFVTMFSIIIGILLTVIFLFTVPEIPFFVLTALVWAAVAVFSRYIFHKIEVLRLELKRITSVEEPVPVITVPQTYDQWAYKQENPRPANPYIYAVYPRVNEGAPVIIDQPPNGVYVATEAPSSYQGTESAKKI